MKTTPYNSPIHHHLPSFKTRKITSALLTNRGKWRCLMSSDLTYIHKYKPKMLSSIQLTFSGDKQISISNIRSLKRALKDNKRSSSLIIKYQYFWPYQETRNIEPLFSVTNRWKTLKISYNDQSDAPTPRDIDNLVRLRRCKDLSDFEISFSLDEPTKNLILEKLSKQFRGLNKIKRLAIDISGCDRAEMMYDDDENYDENASLLKFKFPASLHSLEIVLRGGFLGHEMLAKFVNNIKNCRSLQHLNLNIAGLDMYLQETEAQAWCSLFENLQNLKTFILDGYWRCNLTPQVDQIFLKGLQNLKQLTTFDFKLCFSSANPVEIFFNDLFRNLAALPNLTSLSLQYSNCQLPKDLGFKNLFLGLKQLTRLQEFSFSCYHCRNLDDTCLQHFSLALQYLQNLKKFHLLLPNSGITDIGIISLSESLKELPCIQDLLLDFNQCNNVSYKSIEILSKGLAKLNLASFTLILEQQKNLLQKFFSFWKDKKELTLFSSTLEKFNNTLSTSSLTLSTFSMPSKEFKSFSCALRELKNLTSLSLELPQYDSGNNFESFKSLVSTLKDLPKLKLLWLMAFKGAKLRDQEINCLMVSVRQCRLLEDLKLSFEQVNLTDASLLYFLSGIKELFALKNLHLGFGESQRFTKGEVVKFLNGLAILKRLETLVMRYRIDFETSFRESPENVMIHQKFRYLTNFVVSVYYQFSVYS